MEKYPPPPHIILRINTIRCIKCLYFSVNMVIDLKIFIQAINSKHN